MNKKKFLILIVLTIFCVGICLSSASATTKTTSLPTKMNKYVTKNKWGYKLQSFKFKVPSYQQVCLFVYKNGKIIKHNKYAIKLQYKPKGKGKWKYTPWVDNCISAIYNNIKLRTSDKIGKVYVKIY